MSYTVKRGDTMTSIAQKYHTSVSALMHANPSVHNANKIFVGEHLNLPKDHFEPKPPAHKPPAHKPPAHKPPAHKPPAHKPPVSHKPPPTSGHGASSAAFNNAKAVLGQNIQYLKYHGPLAKYLDKWPSSHVCCANFVSACLEKAGQIKHSEHNDSVRGLANNLRHDKNWSSTTLKNAKPGDVVCFRVPGEGDYAHVEMFAGWKNGKPVFIGSNNANRDGSQRITENSPSYHIDAIFHYHG